MTADALDRAFRIFIHQRPFRSFTLELLSGERLLVAHPEVVMRSRELFIFRGTSGDHRIFAAESVCQLIE